MTESSKNACNSAAYKNAIEQRNRAKFYNVPPPRYNNLANNPYFKINPSTGLLFTNFDLTMRRKAEVLKYSNSSSSTKTNNLTKRQQWAQIVTGKSSLRNSQAYINSDPTPCPQTIVYTSSTASGVPGPPVLLYEDDNVPLYNYINSATQDGNYGIQNSTPTTTLWNIYPEFNSSTIFTTLAIQPNIVNSYYTYSVSIPIVIYVESDASTNNVGTFTYQDPSAIQIWVSKVSLSVLYGQSEVALNTDISYSLSNVFYNSYDNAMNISADVLVNNNIIDPSYNRFYAYGYAGEVKINNIVLPTQSGYIYDMKLKVYFNYITSGAYSTFNSTLNPSFFNTYLNPTYDTTQLQPANCFVTNPQSVTPETLPVFSLTGQ
jgi:hypothetical protein